MIWDELEKLTKEELIELVLEQTQRLTELEEQISRLQLYHYIKWFLVGAGVLLLGFIIGFSAKRQRRRSSLL